MEIVGDSYVMLCYVLMRSHGDYDEYTVGPVVVYLNEDVANGERDRRNNLPTHREYMDTLESDFLKTLPPPAALPNSPLTRPVYDQSRKDDKGYNLSHLKAIREYQGELAIWREEVYQPALKARGVSRELALKDYRAALDHSAVLKNSRDRSEHYWVETVNLIGDIK